MEEITQRADPTGRVLSYAGRRPVDLSALDGAHNEGGAVATIHGVQRLRCVHGVLRVLALVGALALLEACGSSANGPPTQSSTRATSDTSAVQYVAFGDSWPAGAHCSGCKTFAYLWADAIHDETGRPVKFTNFMGVNEHSNGESKTSASLLTALRNDDATKKAVADADVILIATGPNSLDSIATRLTTSKCGGADGHDCIRALGRSWESDFNAILDEIHRLRGERPTAVRLVNAANPFLMDLGMAAAAPKGFANTGGALIFELLTRAQCDAARQHHAVCVDVRPLITGPHGDKNENSDASMKAVAEALRATGLPELKGINAGTSPTR
jgi:hypothetical protein